MTEPNVEGVDREQNRFHYRESITRRVSQKSHNLRPLVILYLLKGTANWQYTTNYCCMENVVFAL